MSIVTKTGDGGQTALFSGENVSKSDQRIEVNGTLDELDSHLGEARLYVKSEEHKELLYKIQVDLKRVMSEIASPSQTLKNPFGEKDIAYLDDYLIKTEKTIQIDSLIIPGECIPSVKLDICRTIARRAEREIVRLNKTETVSPHILSYINRLSDALFIMARIEDNS